MFARRPIVHALCGAVVRLHHGLRRQHERFTIAVGFAVDRMKSSLACVFCLSFRIKEIVFQHCDDSLTSDSSCRISCNFQLGNKNIPPPFDFITAHPCCRDRQERHVLLSGAIIVLINHRNLIRDKTSLRLTLRSSETHRHRTNRKYT